uniref:Uncharacterized protein n=1 Tax=Acrobeloides nanus TaxID=290746 RepID=A0A914DVC0_9BILA
MSTAPSKKRLTTCPKRQKRQIKLSKEKKIVDSSEEEDEVEYVEKDEVQEEEEEEAPKDENKYRRWYERLPPPLLTKGDKNICKMTKNFCKIPCIKIKPECGKCRQRNFANAHDKPDLRPVFIDNWGVRYSEESCAQCASYIVKLSDLITDGFSTSKDQRPEHAAAKWLDAPPPQPLESQLWKLNYSFVSSGFRLKFMCAGCEQRNWIIRQDPKFRPIILKDGWVRIIEELCKKCCQYNAGFVDLYRDGWPSRRQEEQKRGGGETKTSW